MRLIPSVDVMSGRCARLCQGDFAAPRFYERDAGTLLDRYRSLGARWVHVVDLDAARGAVSDNRQLILQLAQRAAPLLQVGGGVRSAVMIEALLAQGVARVVVGSAAAERPQEVAQWLERFGSDRICLAFDVRLDARGVPRVRTNGWRADGGVTLWEALGRYSHSKLKHILCTDIERDGTLDRPNIALYREGRLRFPELAWQASGGIRDAADLDALADAGVAAAVSGRALLEERIDTEELRPFLPDASFPASTCATARS